MIDKKYVQNLLKKIKKGIDKEIKACHLEMALELISSCANVLYNTNIYYVDEDLESALKEIVAQLSLPLVSEQKENVVLFYDGFGVDDRGLASIYIKALLQMKDLIYVTSISHKDQITTLRALIEANGGRVIFIDNNTNNYIEQIRALNRIVVEENPKAFFFYALPNDVVASTVMNTQEGRLLRYQINLTDHAFWLGSRCIDKCIEFRDYGASISQKYRRIPEEKIVKLPFYPELHQEREFQGFPFEIKESQKVIFSGGNLYKTLGDDNKYYHIVEHILDSYEDVIFWYAGFGDDSELQKILKKYPGRAFYTTERKDLYQVIKNSRLYLSTYPIAGGLMYQYAACAGRVPVTLYHDECNDGTLLNQEKIGIEFYDTNELYTEIEKLLYDDAYFRTREKEMLEAVISEETFVENLKSILNGESPNQINYEEIETEKFRSLYLERLKQSDIEEKLVGRRMLKPGLRYVPLEFLRGGYRKLRRRL